jgi:hypothetical protein
MTKRKPKDQIKKMGRPSEYKPEYCEIVLALGKEGKSKAQMCAALDCDFKTLEAWQASNPDFLQSVSKALILAQTWWENAGQEGLFMGVNSWSAITYQFMMKNRFKHDYTDTQKQEHKIEDFGDIQKYLSMNNAAPKRNTE